MNSLKLKEKALEIIRKANIILTKDEIEKMEITDLGLGKPENIGLQLVVYVNTNRVCAKEIVLLPNQICPEHKHPPILHLNYQGKEETFRCRWGKVYLYVPGEPTKNAYGKRFIPFNKKKYFTVWHEIVLLPGEQYTLPPNTLHWFIAGKDGAVISEFSTTSYDEYDVFTDPGIRRV
ncbi:MAG: D-lyxose ketol-isomerase [Oceanotoga sp.]|uniref:hypothetical protein n=1 Tax=Oceanotoga sp. TaxID=2108366 RepID=UPI00264ADE1F|nr:hypothetical protein [Oceanotoga sp.]MDN5343854.1 D-lyxose ketol-isomerase [Oceanotoga sp.]